VQAVCRRWWPAPGTTTGDHRCREESVFYCFAPSCGVRGGLKALRGLLGEHTPAYRQQGAATDESYGDKSGCRPDVEGQRARLVAAFKRLRLPERAQAVGDCRRFYRVGKCTNCARTPAYPISCGDPLCLCCMPGRLLADWDRRRDALPPALDVYRLWPTGVGSSEGVLRRTRGRFAEWRKRDGIGAGIYGLRLDAERRAAVLLAVPAGSPTPRGTRAFEVEPIATSWSPDEFIRWLRDEYVDEAQAWSTDPELRQLIDETKGRRRFQGFGTFYGEPGQESADMDTDEAGAEATVRQKKSLGRVSGGSLRGKREKDGVRCTYCGGEVEFYAFTVPEEQVERIGDGWLYRGPPKPHGTPEGATR